MYMNIYTYLLYNKIYIIKPAYVDIVKTVASYLTDEEPIVPRSLRLGASESGVVLTWLSHTREAKNPVVAQYTRHCPSTGPM